jgi:hypothetical protein
MNKNYDYTLLIFCRFSLHYRKCRSHIAQNEREFLAQPLI